MILTFILAAAAGALVPRMEPLVTEILERVFGEDGLSAEADRMVVTFGLVLFVAALLLKLLGVVNSPAALALGGTLGYLHDPLRRLLLERWR